MERAVDAVRWNRVAGGGRGGDNDVDGVTVDQMRTTLRASGLKRWLIGASRRHGERARDADADARRRAAAALNARLADL